MAPGRSSSGCMPKTICSDSVFFARFDACGETAGSRLAACPAKSRIFCIQLHFPFADNTFVREEVTNMALDVLIVDDSAAIRKILHRVLVQAEIPLGRVVEAGDGVEALQALQNQQVNLILSDINMPNMDGLQLLSALKAQDDLKGVPVIMVTTEGGSSKVMEAVNLGAAGYVRKPFTADQIKEKLAGLY